jgi:hypothetical protein
MTQSPARPSEALLIETAAPVEDLAPGVKKQWVYKGKILIFDITSMAHPAITAWANAMIESRQHWSAQQPYLVMTLSRNSALMALSPSVRHAAQRIAASTPLHIYGRSAVVVEGNPLLAVILKIFMQRDINRKSQHTRGVVRGVFSSRQEALHWLSELLKAR